MSTFWMSMLEGRVRYIDVHGISTRVLEAGDPEDPNTIICLHGAGGQAENFVTNVVTLAQAGHVIAPDLFGHGLNSRPAGLHYDFRGVLDHVKALIETIGARDVSLIGVSLGGVVGANVAAEMPDRIKKLVFICSIGLDPDSLATRARAILSEEERRATFADASDERARALFERGIHNPKSLDEETVKVRTWMNKYPGAADTIVPILRDYDINQARYNVTGDMLKQIQADALFAWGSYNDPGPEVAQKAADLMRSGRVVEFQNSKHWPHVEEREKFHAEVLGFLKS